MMTDILFPSASGRNRSVADRECQPIFLFGMERSGTTLLAMMVGAHPAIAVPLSTTGMWFDFFGSISAEYNNIDTDKGLRRLIQDVSINERIRLWEVKLDVGRIIDQSGLSDFGSVVRAFHQEYAQQVGKTLWANSDIATLDKMHIANTWFEDARFVHLVRDGRDVALSHQTMPFGAGNILECAQAWRFRVEKNLRMGAMVGSERYYLVRYEDLVLQPDKTLRGLCEFLAVPYAKEMLEYARTVDKRVPADRMWLWPALKKPPQKSKVRQWQRKFTSAQRMVFEDVAGPLLQELGYETLGRFRKTPAAAALELCYFMDRGHRWKRFQKRLGLEVKSKLERQSAQGTSRDGPRADNAWIQKEAFNALVSDGTYSPAFDHPERAKKFVDLVMSQIGGRLEQKSRMRVLDCGCGTGAWLRHLDARLSWCPDRRMMGFDLSEGMVKVAKQNAPTSNGTMEFHVGDILDPLSFVFQGSGNKFELIFVYDVIQQLPRRRQIDACRMVIAHLAPGGVALIFDHDCKSVYGRKMGVKKALRRYLGIPLVPSYYCNAHYPDLANLKRVLNDMRGVRADVVSIHGFVKRAVVVESERC